MAIEGERRIVKFRSRDERFYFQRLLDHEARVRPNFKDSYFYFSMQKKHRDPLTGKPHLTKEQAEHLLNWASYSYTRMLKNLGNSDWRVVIDRSRQMQGLEPMEKKDERA